MSTEGMHEFRNRTVVDIRELNKWELKFFDVEYEEYAAMVFDDGIALYFPVPFSEKDVVQIEYPDQVRKFVEEEMWTRD